MFMDNSQAKCDEIRAILCEEYRKRTKAPWIVAYSGGKDSTLLLQLVFEAVLAQPPAERKRQVHIVGNDTLVESPLVIDHLHETMAIFKEAIVKGDLPMSTHITKPCIDETFWVNVIGRGYIPPTRNFRWCTDRLKIAPTSALINRITARNSKSILLIGTRKSESISRRRRMESYEKGGRRMSPHNQIEGCNIFSPLAELTDEDVWEILMTSSPPWGGDHKNLITLYRNALGGECPVVMSKEDIPSCGTTSPRFGCWTCSVVKKDKSLTGLIDSGFEQFKPLLEFRDKIVKLRENDENRMPERRDGSTKLRADGSRVRGPFTMEMRRRILRSLKDLERKTGRSLISQGELEVIKDIWRRDELHYDVRTSLREFAEV